MAFLHLSLALESFSGVGSRRLGWNPAGVRLFRMHVFERYQSCLLCDCYVMSGSGGGLSSSFFRASESNVREFFGGWFYSRLGHLLGWNPAGVWLFRMHADRPLGAHAFAGLLNGFETACYM